MTPVDIRLTYFQAPFAVEFLGTRFPVPAEYDFDLFLKIVLQKSRESWDAFLPDLFGPHKTACSIEFTGDSSASVGSYSQRPALKSYLTAIIVGVNRKAGARKPYDPEDHNSLPAGTEFEVRMSLVRSSTPIEEAGIGSHRSWLGRYMKSLFE